MKVVPLVAEGVVDTSLPEGFAVSATGLTVPRGRPLEEHLQAARLMGTIARVTPWWIGDLLYYSDLEFGERAAQISAVLPLAPDTLIGYQWVASRFVEDLSTLSMGRWPRRRPGLSWGHHQAVAALDAAEADRLLDQAEEGNWSVSQMREARTAVKAKAASTSAKPDTRPEQLVHPSVPPIVTAIDALSRAGPARDWWERVPTVDRKLVAKTHRKARQFLVDLERAMAMAALRLPSKGKTRKALPRTRGGK